MFFLPAPAAFGPAHGAPRPGLGQGARIHECRPWWPPGRAGRTRCGHVCVPRASGLARRGVWGAAVGQAGKGCWDRRARGVWRGGWPREQGHRAPLREPPGRPDPGSGRAASWRMCPGLSGGIRKVCVPRHFSRVQPFATLRTVAHQAPLSMGFSRQEHRSGLPSPPPGDLPDTGIKPGSPTLQADSLLSEPSGKPHIRCKE